MKLDPRDAARSPIQSAVAQMFSDCTPTRLPALADDERVVSNAPNAPNAVASRQSPATRRALQVATALSTSAGVSLADLKQRAITGAMSHAVVARTIRPGAVNDEIVTDFSRSKGYRVESVQTPSSLAELASLVAGTTLPVSIRGGGFSMGGQTIAANGLVIDMKNLNKVVDYQPAQKTITVQAGMTWRDLQKVIDPDGLSVKVMQTYNNFTVGGSLGVNVHGRYVGYGPIISTVQSIKVLLADGSIVNASRTENVDLFEGAIGGYGGLGVIVEATLDLADNVKLERRYQDIKASSLEQTVRDYVAYFDEHVAGNPNAVMTNADLYPPAYDLMRSVTYYATDKAVTVTDRLQEPCKPNIAAALRMSALELAGPVKRYRQSVFEPRELNQERVVYRNWEASYHAQELEGANQTVPLLRKVLPFSNRKSLLQEYFIPKSKLAEFVPKMCEIFKKRGVNVANVSFRHVPKNTESTLSWAKDEMFALVVYYTQSYGPYGIGKEGKLKKAQEWTQEMIDAINAVDGSYYLPYQTYATPAQFERAYPRHAEFFAAKQKYDPNGLFGNNLWEQYMPKSTNHSYKAMLSTEAQRAELAAFFTNIFNIYEPDAFIHAIDEAIAKLEREGRDPNDRNVYLELMDILPKVSTGAAQSAFKTIASLKKQQREMAEQTAKALGRLGVQKIDGYVEIGTVGRYVNYLKSSLPMTGRTYVVSDEKPGFSIPAVVESTGGYGALDPRSYRPSALRDKFVPFSNYDMITQLEVPNNSVDLASIYIGLHHAPPEKLAAFVASVYRMLRPGGKVVLRDHDATTEMVPLIDLAHDTYNAGLGIPVATNMGEIRNFRPLSFWKQTMADAGFADCGVNTLQDGDPTRNTLMVFEKPVGATDLPSSVIERLEAGDMRSIADLKALPDYHRPVHQTYMTQPEWVLVDVFQSFADFQKTKPWYEFPFDDYVDVVAKVYKRHRAYAVAQGVADTKAFGEYEDMDKGLVAAVRVMFKTMKLAADFFKGDRIPSQILQAQAGNDASTVYKSKPEIILQEIFTTFAAFMVERPWYEFPFPEYIKRAEEAYAAFRDQLVASGVSPKAVEGYEKLDKGLHRAMDVFFKGMALAGKMVTKSLENEDVAQTTQLVVRGSAKSVESMPPSLIESTKSLGGDLYLLTAKRYVPFTHMVRAIADRRDTQVVEVAGNQNISVLVKSDRDNPLRFSMTTDSIMGWQLPASPGHYQTIKVPVTRLTDFVTEAEGQGCEVVRVHDF